jgi:hypothetical protein
MAWKSRVSEGYREVVAQVFFGQVFEPLVLLGGHAAPGLAHKVSKGGILAFPFYTAPIPFVRQGLSGLYGLEALVYP